jgi:ParB family transcriptional regulator, chromosome partitioning protein
MAAEEARVMKKLGRGLSALLGDGDPDFALAAEGGRGQAKQVPIEFLRPSALQPRRHFDETELENLAESIREKGILQPIIVRPDQNRTNGYEIVAGERRWRAAQRAQLHDVPVQIKELDDGEVLEIALIENIQRSDLNAVEEAQGYVQLMERFGHTQEELGKLLGKSRSHVANTIRLLGLPENVKNMVVDGRLSAGHARTLVATEDPEALADKIVALQLSVRDAESLARSKSKATPRKPGAKAEKDPDTRALEESVSSALGMRVTVLDHGAKGGEIRIAYMTLEQLDEICRRLRRPAMFP